MKPVSEMKFGALSALPESIVHGFTLRNDPVAGGWSPKRLDPVVSQAISRFGFPEESLFRAEQVHGAEVAVIGVGEDRPSIPGVDGLLTNVPGTLLEIRVADCCAVYLVDARSQAIGLVHSGKRGTELGIVPAAIGRMVRTFESRPADLIVQLSPCIRPPFYEVDFARTIREQCLSLGVPPANLHDSGLCTAADLTRFYSYRAEKGRTGRMLALLGLRSTSRS